MFSIQSGSIRRVPRLDVECRIGMFEAVTAEEDKRWLLVDIYAQTFLRPF